MRLPWGDEIAIDLGTENTHICVKDAGVVVREASYIAFDSSGRKSIAVGLEAKRMLERDVENVRVVRPIRGGVVADFDATVLMLRHFIHQALGKRPLLSPLVITSHPDEATQVERRALIDAIRAAGGGQVLSIQRALATAIGGGLPVSGDNSHMVVDLGAGMTNVGIVAMGLATTGVSIRRGGDDLNEVIRRAVRRSIGLRINSAAAEHIKIHVGTLLGGDNPDSIRVDGIGADGQPVISTDINLGEIPGLLTHGLNGTTSEIMWLLEELSPREQGEIAANGGVLTGAGAMLEGADSFFAERLGIPITVATDPSSCTILGLESVLSDPQGVSLEGRRFKRTG